MFAAVVAAAVVVAAVVAVLVCSKVAVKSVVVVPVVQPHSTNKMGNVFDLMKQSVFYYDYYLLVAVVLVFVVGLDHLVEMK